MQSQDGQRERVAGAPPATRGKPLERRRGKPDPLPPRGIAEPMLAWYDRERRHLPWRSAPGATADPYKVWLSEVMLQQTTTKAVIPYFETFTQRWPTVEALAAAALEDILAAWAGLGYYARARKLHACATEVVAHHASRFPADETALLALPGIGAYTAAAISAIGFGRKAVVVDGNVERVVARLRGIETPLPKAKMEIRAATAGFTPDLRAGDFAQAMMDLGATLCTPRRPSCPLCPVATACVARKRGIADTLPRRAAKSERPMRRGVAFLALRADGAVLLRRRAPEGLLGGMMEVPASAWDANAIGRKDTHTRNALADAPVRAAWRPVPGTVVHVFTHFRLEIEVYRALVPMGVALHARAGPARCRFVHRSTLANEALPNLMRKIIAHGLKGL